MGDDDLQRGVQLAERRIEALGLAANLDGHRMEGPTVGGGRILAAANRDIHAAALAVLSGAPDA